MQDFTEHIKGLSIDLTQKITTLVQQSSCVQTKGVAHAERNDAVTPCFDCGIKSFQEAGSLWKELLPAQKRVEGGKRKIVGADFHCSQKLKKGLIVMINPLDCLVELRGIEPRTS